MRKPIAAIKELLDGHWLKGQFSDGRGNYCLVGANQHIDPEHELDRERFLQQAILDLFSDCLSLCRNPDCRVCNDPRSVSISIFNDHPDTTWEDIVRVLDRAAELEAQETDDALS